MAYRRSITGRVKLFYQQQHRITPLFSHAHRHDSDGEGFPAKSVSRNFEIGSCIQNRFLGTKSNLSNFQRSSNFVGFGLDFGRSFSRLSVGEGVADGIEFRSDAVEAAANAAPVVSEVAAAAADSAGPVAAVQYLIDYIHCCTGFNWWASIAVATVLVRCLQIPFYLWELKIRSKMAPVKKDYMAIGGAHLASKKKVMEISEKYAVVNGITGYARTKAVLYDASLPYLAVKIFAGVSYSTFFLALHRMADKIPSLKEGDIIWFMDFTTTDNIGFSILMALMLHYAMKIAYKEDNTPIGAMEYWNAFITVLSFPILAVCPK